MSELDATVDSLRALELLRPMTPKYIVLFFSLALLLGWIGYAPSFLSSYGLLDWPLPLIVAFVIIGGGSPTFAELITTRLEHGRDGPASLFRQFNPKGVPRVWFVVSLALPVGMCLCVVGLWLALGNTYKLDVGLPAEEIPLLLSNLAVNTWEEVGREATLCRCYKGNIARWSPAWLWGGVGHCGMRLCSS